MNGERCFSIEMLMMVMMLILEFCLWSGFISAAAGGGDGEVIMMMVQWLVLLAVRIAVMVMIQMIMKKAENTIPRMANERF